VSIDDDMKRLILILHKKHKYDFETASDMAAAAFLRDGETEPLIKYLLTGEPLTPILHETLIKVLQEGSLKKIGTPYKLKPVRRDGKRGAPKNRLSKIIRDEMVGEGVKELMEAYGPGGYDAAINEATNITGLKKSTVRNAHSRMKDRNSK